MTNFTRANLFVLVSGIDVIDTNQSVFKSATFTIWTCILSNLILNFSTGEVLDLKTVLNKHQKYLTQITGN